MSNTVEVSRAGMLKLWALKPYLPLAVVITTRVLSLMQGDTSGKSNENQLGKTPAVEINDQFSF